MITENNNNFFFFPFLWRICFVLHWLNVMIDNNKGWGFPSFSLQFNTYMLNRPAHRQKHVHNPMKSKQKYIKPCILVIYLRGLWFIILTLCVYLLNYIRKDAAQPTLSTKTLHNTKINPGEKKQGSPRNYHQIINITANLILITVMVHKQ